MSGSVPKPDIDTGAFRACGYAQLERRLSAEQQQDLARAFDELLVDANERHDARGELVSRAAGRAHSHRAVAALAARPDLLGEVESALGAPALFMGSFVLENHAGSHWHLNGLPGDDTESVRVTVYLDRARHMDECLQVLPGSHHAGYSRALYEAHGDYRKNRVWLDWPGGQPPGAVPLASDASDLLVWDPRLWHGASPRPDGAPRRGVFLTYVPDPGEDTLKAELLRREYRKLRNVQTRYIFSETLREHASMRSMAERLEQLGVKDLWPSGE